MTPRPQFIELDTVESTMIEASDRLERHEIGPWTTIIAHHQTRGRGRLDRRWEDKRGDALLATVLAPLQIPPERIGLVALATGLAVADAISEWNVPVTLKWPNDLYVDNRKLGGILIQTRLNTMVTALIGIGINLTSVPADHSASATCLADYLSETPQPRAFAETIVFRLQARAEQLDSGRWPTITDDWMARAAWIGETVTVVSSTPVEGRFIGVDEFGRALVSSESGIQAFAEGDVQRGPRQSLYLDMN